LPVDVWFNLNWNKERYTYKQVSIWAKVFGKENICVRPYEKQQYVGGDIFSDFLHQLGLEMTDEFQKPPRQINTSYRVDALEAMRLLNALPLACHQEIDALLQRYSDTKGRDGDWPYALLSPAQRLSVCEFYAEANASIARNFLNRSDGRLFYEPLPDPSEPWQPYPGLSDAQIVEIIRYIEQHAPAVSAKLADAVAIGLRSRNPDMRQAAQALSAGFKYSSTQISKRNRVIEFLRPIYNRLPVRLRDPLKYAIRSTRRRLKCAFGGLNT